MPDQPYADAVAELLDRGYDLESVTQPEVVCQALNSWLRQQVERAVQHHAAVTGTGHQPDDHCDGWHALQDALQGLHDGSREFVLGLLTDNDHGPVEGAER
jgi:hypothetical protein